MSNKLFYRLGLEDLVEDAPADEPESLEEIAGESSPESDVLAAEEQGEEVEGDADDVEAIDADTETMGEVVKGLEAALKSGKPTKDAIVFSNMAINAVNRKWFGGTTLTVSAESINSPEDAVVASMEGALDKIKELGRALIEKLKKLWNTFSGWIKSVFDGSAKLTARANALAKKAGEMAGKAAGTVDFKESNTGLLETLEINGKLNKDTVVAGTASVASLIAALHASATIAADMGAIGEKVFKATTIDAARSSVGEGVKQLNTAYENVLKPLDGMVVITNPSRAPESATVARGKKILPGNNGLYIIIPSGETPKDLGEASRMFGKYKFTIMDLLSGADRKLEGEAIAPKDVKALATAAAGIFEKIGSYKKAYAQREHLRGLVIKQLESSAKEATGNNEGDKARIAQERSNFARAFGTAWSALVSADYMIVNYVQKTAKAYLAYGDLCLKAAGGGEKAEEPKKEEPAAA
jgi:hypothetical protein